jgi:hypothetical protein
MRYVGFQLLIFALDLRGPGLNEGFFREQEFRSWGRSNRPGRSICTDFFCFSCRVRTPSPVTSQWQDRPVRLAIVDAFDLDRQRQLVIVRRDNVEHLLIIGGANDLVIESQIIRSESGESRSLREAKFRDKELREREPNRSPHQGFPRLPRRKQICQFLGTKCRLPPLEPSSKRYPQNCSNAPRKNGNRVSVRYTTKERELEVR